MFLHVYGPDSELQVQEFVDVLGCMQYQAELERRLVGEGFWCFNQKSTIKNQ